MENVKMELVVSNHAWGRMADRGITKELILDAFNTGYVKVFNGQIRYFHELITLVVDIDTDDIKLITTFPSRRLQNRATKYNKRHKCGITKAQKLMLEQALESYNKSQVTA